MNKFLERESHILICIFILRAVGKRVLPTAYDPIHPVVPIGPSCSLISKSSNIIFGFLDTLSK